MPGTKYDERLLPFLERLLANDRRRRGIAVASWRGPVEEYLDSTRRRESLIDLLHRFPVSVHPMATGSARGCPDGSNRGTDRRESVDVSVK